jgi:plastocyanin
LTISRCLARPSKPLAVVALLTLALPPVAGAGAGAAALQGHHAKRRVSARSPIRDSRPAATLRTARNGSVAAGALVAHHARHQTNRGVHKQAPTGAQKPAQPGTHQTKARAAQRRRTWRSRTKASDIRAHAAGDPNATISDFKFTPASLTIHVGDTITWVNNGPSEHSATANNGSFNTGLLKKGASASHTFTTAGTFTYFCSIHPFMHGTVVVLANAASSTPPTTTTTPNTSTTPSSTSTTPSSTATTANTDSTLPDTGIDAVLVFGVGIGMACIGIALRGTFRRDA